MNYKIFKNVFLAIILVELVSFLGYFYPFVNKAAFFVIIAIALAASLYKLEYGLLIMLAELIIGSKGYLFYFDAQGFSVSIRIALFIVVMAVWSGKIISNLIKNKKLELEFLKSPLAKYFIILFIFIVWGIINGVLKGNSFNNLFFDFNGWLYFLIVFPVYDAIKVPMSSKMFLEFLIAALFWLCFKTFFLLFLFSHFSMDVVYEIYRWVRVTGVGEIAQIQGGFYRIFFQSHIFALLGFFVLLVYFMRRNKGSLSSDTPSKNNKNAFLFFCFLVFLLSCILISFSRSFWIGLIFGLILFFIYLIWRKSGLKKILQISSFLILSFAISVGFVALIVKFPYPRPTGGFNTAELLSERASEIKGEAAVASRWSLLPELWKEIKTAPILGKGFGATVTYKSSDPRILEQDPKGEYTTYAFEWGWLDIWLKLGIGGMIAYIFLIGKIIYDGLNKISNIGLLIGLAAIAIVNIFTPYLNHPLGIGYLILTCFILDKNKMGSL